MYISADPCLSGGHQAVGTTPSGDPFKSPRGAPKISPRRWFSLVSVRFPFVPVGSAQPGFGDPWASKSNQKIRKRDSEKRSPKSNPCKIFWEPFRSSKRDLRRKIRLLHFQETQSGICNPYNTFGLPEHHFLPFSDSCHLPSEQTLHRFHHFLIFSKQKTPKTMECCTFQKSDSPEVSDFRSFLKTVTPK